ncbi:MAG: hypothetical protein V4710_22805 [Verrucomicrobiota bacterium]
MVKTVYGKLVDVVKQDFSQTRPALRGIRGFADVKNVEDSEEISV